MGEQFPLPPSIPKSVNEEIPFPEEFSRHDHNHSGVYSPVAHNHAGVYSPVAHTHPGMGVPLENLLTNGGFEVWQRGAGPFTADNAHSADRWRLYLAGGDSLQVNREVAIKKDNSLYSAKLTYTKAAGTATQLYQNLMITDNFHYLLGTTVSLKVSIHCNAVNAVRVFIGSNGTGGTTTYSDYHTGDSNFTELTVENITIPTDATYISIGILVSETCLVYADNAMLIIGGTAIDFCVGHPAEEMAKCQRYYEVHGGNAAISHPVVIGYGLAGEVYGSSFSFNTIKGVVPSLTKNGTWAVNNCGQPTVELPSVNGYVLQSTVTANGRFAFNPDGVDDTVTIEANP